LNAAAGAQRGTNLRRTWCSDGKGGESREEEWSGKQDLELRNPVRGLVEKRD